MEEERERFFNNNRIAEKASSNGNAYRELMKQYRQFCEPIVLLDHQEEIYQRFNEQINSDKKILIDLSELGSGKSYVLMKLAYENDFTVLYISSDLAVTTMKELMLKYGVYHLNPFTFNSLTPGVGMITNPYVSNFDGVYTINNNFKKILREHKIIVVIDEIQAAKNSDAKRSDSIRVLLNPVYFPEKHGYEDTGAKVCLLSGTLFDKKRHASQMIYLTNFCGSTEYTSKLYYQEDGIIIDHMKAGFGEIVYSSIIVNQELTEQIVGGIKYSKRGVPIKIGNPFTEGSCIEMVYLIFIHIVLPYYSHAVSKPQCPFPKYGRNIYSSLTSDQKDRFKQLLRRREYTVHDNGFIKCSGRNSSYSRFALINMIHDFKAELLVKKVLQEVESGMKCIIYTEYDTSTDIICDTLRKRKCKYVRICGDTKISERYHNITSFNEDKRVKVIVCKKAIASASINLHCKKSLEEGGEIRSLHIIPGYDLTQDLQSVDRVDRVERATDVHINVWWCRSSNKSLNWLERDLLANLEEKISVIREVSRVEELEITREFFTEYEKEKYNP
jgi:hypothetical protein